MSLIITRPTLVAIMVSFIVSTAIAQESRYTTINLDKDCVFEQPANDENAGPGSSAVCRIKGVPVIYFVEGDLRQSLGFGAPQKYQTFGQFNRMSATVEWREHQGRPFAAIMRFFIENMNPDSGAVEKSREGQVLVVHRVAQNSKDQTCIVGMVDARANKNANVIAREVADEITEDFKCGKDRPNYYGKKGQYAGDLM